MKKISIIVVILFSFYGCGTKVKVNTLMPSEVSAMSSHKKIKVNNFIGDNIGFTNRLKASLINLKYDNLPYFELTYTNPNATINGQIDYGVMNNLYENVYIVHYDKDGKKTGEKKYQSSATKKDYNFNKKDNKKKNFPRDEVNVELCLEKSVHLGGNIEVTAGNKILYVYPIDNVATQTDCSFYIYPYIDDTLLVSEVQNSAINDFVGKIAPKKITYEIKIIDKPEDGYTKDQKEMFLAGIVLIKEGRYLEAEALFERLVAITNGYSFAAFYDYGTVLEANGKYDKAKTTYEKASKIPSKNSAMALESIYRVSDTKFFENSAIKELKNKH
ncbi:MAG: tetratricopeptide repeat protein [Sulfurovaceae bacterium]|nr:tetratricopeptide repeat protein [Sulfurovaceae bacterium]MDD5548204.1 tetratricopeptide repeat protein [Sulfurovaceae bacterium]